MSIISMPVEWTLEEGLEIIHKLQLKVRNFNYHICLGGSVLNYGNSLNDLDLYFLSLSNGLNNEPEKLVQFLTDEIGNLENLMKEEYMTDTKYVGAFKTSINNKRIDIFIL